MQIQSEFTVAHLNVRKEKAGDNPGPVAVDIKLSASLTPDELSGLFATQASFDRILGQLWNKEDELTTTDLEQIKLLREGIGCVVSLIPQISGDKVTLEGANVNKIVLKPLAGRKVELSIRVQGRPTREQLGRLAEWLDCSLNVAISQRQGELSLAAGQSPAEPEESQPEHAGLLDGGIDKTLEADRESVQRTVNDLAEAGVVRIAGQKPPQRPKQAAAKTKH